MVFWDWGHLSTKTSSSKNMGLWQAGAGARMLGEEGLAAVSRRGGMGGWHRAGDLEALGDSQPLPRPL